MEIDRATCNKRRGKCAISAFYKARIDKLNFNIKIFVFEYNKNLIKFI